MVIPKQFSLPLVQREQIAHETYSLYFDISHTDFLFYPGQYVRITLTSAIGGKDVSRFFTIASSPLEKNHIMITIKKGKSEFKNALLTSPLGQYIAVFGPLGGFYLRDDTDHDYVFLAGGIGITPFHSMLTYATEKKMTNSFTLLSSFSKPEEIIYYEKFTAFAEKHGNVRTIYTVTSSQASKIPWHGETGRISALLIKKYISSITQPVYYIVGPLAMVSETEELLLSLGIPQEQIKIEQFIGY